MKKKYLAIVLTLALGMAAPAVTVKAEDGAAAATLTQAWAAYNMGRYAETVRLISPLAEAGNARAQIMLGRCYENGVGLPQDMVQAARLYRAAADQGDAEAMVLLAYCYEVGAGVPLDVGAVVSWMRRAAEAGNAEARFNLALYYSKGAYQTAKDQKQSFFWAQAAAEQGYAQAQRFVGACYEYGFGVVANAGEAEVWYKRAADQGLVKEGNIFNTVREYTMD